jgi:hypothetical protein
MAESLSRLSFGFPFLAGSRRPKLPFGRCGEVWGGVSKVCPGLSGRRSRGECMAIPIIVSFKKQQAVTKICCEVSGSLVRGVPLGGQCGGAISALEPTDVE